MKVKYQKLAANAFLPVIEENVLKIFANQILDNNYFTVSYTTGIKIIVPKDHLAILLPAQDCSTRKLSLDNSLTTFNLDDEIKLKFSKTLSAAHINIYQPGDCIAQLLIIETKTFTLEENIILSERDYKTFASVINNPPEPNDSLKKAVEKNFKNNY